MNEIIKRFFEETKTCHSVESDQEKGLPQPPLEKLYKGEVKTISLPKVESLKISADLTTVIHKRRSHRKYLDKPVTLEELAYLLWATVGVKEVRENRVTLRTVPSAGARHAFETYLYVNNVVGLKPGLYRYLALAHELAEVEVREGLNQELVQATGGQKFVGTAAVTFIWVAVAYRMAWRYTQRGYRYLFLDAGHVCQNLYLAAEAMNCGCCAVAYYDDDALNNLLKLDGEEEFAIYLAPLGKIREEDD